MQKATLKAQLEKQLEEVKKAIASFEDKGGQGVEETDQLLAQVEALYRKLSAFQHIIHYVTPSSELDVHMKIIQAVEKKEEAKIEVKTPREESQVKLEIPEVKEPVTENTKIIAATQEKVEETTTVNVKKIELGINDKYRIINELFGTQQSEFNAALQQLNSIDSWNSAQTYLNSLQSVYQWKHDSPLVKTFYSLVQKRFS